MYLYLFFTKIKYVSYYPRRNSIKTVLMSFYNYDCFRTLTCFRIFTINTTHTWWTVNTLNLKIFKNYPSIVFNFKTGNLLVTSLYLISLFFIHFF